MFSLPCSTFLPLFFVRVREDVTAQVGSANKIHPLCNSGIVHFLFLRNRRGGRQNLSLDLILKGFSFQHLSVRRKCERVSWLRRIFISKLIVQV